MLRRQYSVAEVEALIPTLERIFAQILQLRIGLRAIEQKLERAGVTIEVAEESGDEAADESLEESADDVEIGVSEAAPSSEAPEVRHARAVFHGLYEALSDGLQEIRALGGEVKDLELGLVDFPGRRDGDDILICWRLGEKRIEYWHTEEGGFANRRPFDETIPRTPSRLD
jgi:hypothetical protein